jgi:hypothetical protein
MSFSLSPSNFFKETYEIAFLPVCLLVSIYPPPPKFLFSMQSVSYKMKVSEILVRYGSESALLIRESVNYSSFGNRLLRAQ